MSGTPARGRPETPATGACRRRSLRRYEARADAWRERTDAALEVQYGSTDTTLTVTYSDRGADIEQLAESIGRPEPEIELRLADDHGRPVADGESGEIQVRHPGVFAGYLGRPEATRDVFTDDGFLRTGDIAVRQDNGTLRLVGRRSDMYKSGGSNVYPREIELCLERHRDVAIAAVVSVPDPLYSEVGHAFVVPVAGRSLDPTDLAYWLLAASGQLQATKVDRRRRRAADAREREGRPPSSRGACPRQSSVVGAARAPSSPWLVV